MKQSKPLTRKQYMAKLSRSARWRLPPQEANEVIADYHEMVYQEGRDEQTLVQELGAPDQAVWLLTDAKTYRRWLWVFGILAVGLFLCAKWCWMGWSRFYRILWWDQMWFPVLVMVVGLVLSLVWFRRHGYKYGSLSKRLLLSLAIVLIFGVGTMAWTWHMFDPVVLETYAELAVSKGDTIPWQVILCQELLIDGGLACAVIALVGLILARCKDRRWLALYALALTVAAMCGFVIFNLKSMDLSCVDRSSMQFYFLSHLLPVGAVGLIGTGVALC